MKRAAVIFLTLVAVIVGMGQTVRTGINALGGESQQGYVLTNSRDHNENHFGNKFCATSYATPSAPVRSTTFLFLTGSKLCFLSVATWSSKDQSSYFYEGATTTGGTVVSGNCLNLISNSAPTASVFLNPTVSDFGTTLIFGRLYLNTERLLVGRVRSGDYFVLAPNTSYLIKNTITMSGGNHEAFFLWVEK